MTIGEYMMAVSKIDEEIEDIERTLEDTGAPVTTLERSPVAIRERPAVKLLEAELMRKRAERKELYGLEVEKAKKEKAAQ